MRGDWVDSEHKRPEGWQLGSDKLSTGPEPDPTDGAEQGSSAARPEHLTSTAKPSTREIESSPTKNTTSLYQAPRLHGLVQSTKQWLIGVQHKLAARGASRKAKKEARELEKMRSLLLIGFWPAEQADQAQSKVADKVDKPADEPRRPPESQARVRAEQERQQTEIEQARLRAEEETRRAEEERRLAEAQARIRAEQERQAGAEREQARLRAEEETRRAEEERRLAEAQARIRAEQERQAEAEREQLRLRAEEETRRTEEERRLAKWQAGIIAEEERQQAETEEARLRAEEETLRAKEEHRLAESRARIRAERERQLAEREEARLRAEEETRRAEERRLAEWQASLRAEQERQRAEAEQVRRRAEEQRLRELQTKQCPKCNRVFSGDRDYCLYDASWLVSPTDARLTPAPKPDATAGSMVWMLVIITFLAAGILGALLIDYVPNGLGPTSEETNQGASVEQDRPVVGGTLNGKQIMLPNPEYPERARTEGVSGKVTVAVLVDKNGTVRSARVLNGHPLLQEPALAAARKTKFDPEKLVDQRARISGTITYNFKL